MNNEKNLPEKRVRPFGQVAGFRTGKCGVGEI